MGTQQMIYAAVASVIAGLVLFSMYAVQLRGQEASIDAVQYRSAKKSVLSLVEVLERDLNNLGACMYWDSVQNKYKGIDDADTDCKYWDATASAYKIVDGPEDILQAGGYDSTAVTGGYRYWFQFLSQTDSLSALNAVRYEWEPIDGETTTLADGTDRQLYEVRRFVGGSLTTSSRLVTDFRITLLPDESGSLDNLCDARVFVVRIRSISPLGKADTVEETLFDATYRPHGITIWDQQDIPPKCNPPVI